MSTEPWAPDEPDELDYRLRSLEAERLRPVPKVFTHRAQGSEYNALTRAYEAQLSTSGRTPNPSSDPQASGASLPSETESEAAARRAALLAELGDEDDEEEPDGP